MSDKNLRNLSTKNYYSAGNSARDEEQVITGYRSLTEAEIDSINQIKAMAENVSVSMKSVEELHGVDKRWLAIANTHLQQGFMAAVRSVAKPETY